MRRLSCRALALMPALLLLPTLRAQDNQSHVIDPDLMPSKNISKFLDPKKLKGKGQNLDVEMMKRLLDFMKDVDPKDVRQEDVDQFLRNNPEFRDPKNLERLRNLAQNQKDAPPNPNDKQRVDWPRVQNQLKDLDEARKKPIDDNPPKENNPVARPPMEKRDPRPQTNTPRPKKDKESENFAKWVAKNFGNSPDAKNMAKDFAKIMGSDKKGGSGFFKDLEKEWKAFGGDKGGRNDANSNLRDLARRFNPPDTGGGGGGGGRPSGGNNAGGSSGGSSSFTSSSSSGGGGWSFGGGGSGGGSWAPVLILLVLAAAGFLLFMYTKRHKKPVEEAPVETARVWPLNPLEVNSREDVVKAFEFLSISKCGNEAVNWHHMQIADQMSHREPVHKDAAGRLARLYEKARYAPANELFDDLDLAEARARFSQLAGAHVA